MESYTSEKQDLREQYLKLRNGLNTEYRIDASKLICNSMHSIIKPKLVISGYYPIKSEADIMPLLISLNSSNSHYEIGLPSTAIKGHPQFRLWQPNQPLIPGSYTTILEPNPKISKIIHPDIILVPLIVFDRKMNRLGHGNGFYDKILKDFPNALKIGCAFSIQEAKSIPKEPHDIMLDVIITEKEIIKK